MATFILTIEADANYAADIPTLEVLVNGAVVSSSTITSTTTSYVFELDYNGNRPGNFSLRFMNDGSGETRDINLSSVRINGQEIADTTYINTLILNNQGDSSTIDVVASDFLYGRIEPNAADLGTVTISGTGGDDFLQGLNNTDDVIDAGVGNDFVYGRSGDDAINAGVGNDYVFGEGGNDLVIAGAGNDYVLGGDGDDLLFGQADDDYLIGGSGNDTLNGGTGNDGLIGDDGMDVLYGDDGDDWLIGDAGDDTLYGDDGNDIMIGGADNDRLYGGNDNDQLIGEGGDDILQGQNGDDEIIAGSGDDTVRGGNNDDIIFGEDGVDSLRGDSGNDYVSGGDGNDIVEGDAGNDVLIGGAGADTINGDNDNDILHGHGLDATTISDILFNNANVIYSQETGSFYQFISGPVSWSAAQTGAAATTLNGVGGHVAIITTAAENQVIYDLSTANSVSNSIGASGNRVWLSATDTVVDQEWRWVGGAEDGLQFSQGNSATYNFYTNWGSGQPNNSGGSQTRATMWFNGGADDDTWDDRNDSDGHNYIVEWEGGLFSDDNAADILNGGNGDDYLYGWGGNDTLRGGNGNDFAFGGDGDDVMDGDANDDTLVGNDGADNIDGGTGNDNLFGGDGNDTLDGEADDDNIEGGDGDDTIRGGLGDDTIDGGAGTDTASYTDVNAAVTVDLSITVAQNTIGGGIDTLINIENVTGDNLADTLTGNGNANVLTGNNGNDVLSGGGGDDTLYGGNNDDSLTGGAGADIMRGGNNNDSFFVSGTDGLGDEYYGDGGTDRVYLQADVYFNTSNVFSSLNSIETGGFDVLAEVNGGFNLSGQTINGGGELLGNTGNETITGSNSNDTIRGGNGVDTLNGGNGNDDIYGDAGDDIIDGDGGNDNIYGGAGADIMNGDGGNDSFFISGTDALGDQYLGDGGTDRVYLQADVYFNTANVFSSLNSIETAGFDIIADLGNGFDLTGQTVNGGGELLGQTGNETITGSNSADTIRGGDGLDVLNGGNGVDTIYGDAGVDTIDGGAGDDEIYGGAGADILNGGNNNDNFYISGTDSLGDQYDGGANNDEIYLLADSSFNSANTFVSINTIQMGGFNINIASGATVSLSAMAIVYGGGEILGTTGNETITGSNSTADLIRGGDGLDVISGAGGNDELYGEAGADTINGDGGSDLIYGGAGADILNGGTGNDDFFISGTDALGDQYTGGGGNDEIHLLANVYFNTSNTFTDMDDIESGGFIIYADTGTGFDLTGMTITGGSDLRGQGGNEVITGSNSNDTIRGDAGNDTLSGGNGVDTIYGDAGVDTINGDAGNDLIYGGAGADILNGGANNDDFYISGTDSLGDSYNGGTGTDEIRLEADVYFNLTNSFVDVEDIESGGFIIYADTGTGFDISSMTITGGSDLRGQGGAEDITGSRSADTIRGEGGVDTLDGGDGADTIYGGAGDDTVYGGVGGDRDNLYGDGGADTFLLDAFDREHVRDFSLTDGDFIDISDILSGFYDPVTDTLTDFVRITNSGANSDLRVDTTGSGSFGSATRVATLYGITGLTDEEALETAGTLITA